MTAVRANTTGPPITARPLHVPFHKMRSRSVPCRASRKETLHHAGMLLRLVALAYALLLAGCAAPGASTTPTPPPPSASSTPSETAASQPPASSGDELSGVLGTDSIEGGCPYLETGDGTRYEVLYPTGWNVDRASGALSDPTGAVVAGPGAVVTVWGEEASDMASICMIGPIFQASEVVSVE